MNKKLLIRESLLIVFAGALLLYSCRHNPPAVRENNPVQTSFSDHPFWQEYHEAYPVGSDPEANQVRSIAVDGKSNVWIATAAGIRSKKANQPEWKSLMSEADQGPAFSVAIDQQATEQQTAVWMGTWNGLYRFKDNQLERLPGPEAPISAVCVANEGVYALGPHGTWLVSEKGCKKLDYPLARSIRNVISDNQGGLWVASDVGLYHCTPDTIRHFQKKGELLSAYVKGVALDNNQHVWAGGLGGVTIVHQDEKDRELVPAQGIPSVFVNCVERSPDGAMWVGTQVGIVRYETDGTHSLRFTRRWLLDDQVNDVAFDAEGTAWIATAKGVSAIRKRKMTLADKQDYFYGVLMQRHIRAPWIAGQCRLDIPGDLASWKPEDDDNDGEYTGNYLAMESFRFAATKSKDTREKAGRAFDFLKLQQEITGTDGFFARTIVPSDWAEIHDGNRIFTDRQLADELVKEPRFKPVEVRWRKSKDGKWLWKGDTSSDEICGHMMGYFFYYELVADEPEKARVRQHVARIVDHLMANNFALTDVDGRATRWGVWSPDKLNHDPEWRPDRSLNSMELLAFVKLAYYVTGEEKYQREYLRLIKEEGYLKNMADIPNQNPAWFIYYDVTLAAYLYPILLKCEKDPETLAFYKDHLEHWFESRKGDQNPLFNFLYSYATGKKAELTSSVEFLTDTPLDLVDWTIDHSKREDVTLVHAPVMDDFQVDKLPPASIRATVRWDKNPWSAISGTPDKEREPVFWLLPYWMGRYLKMIQ